MLEDIMNKFAHDTNSIVVRAIISHQKTIRDLAKEYDMDTRVFEDMFSQVYVICVYNAQKKSYTVNFEDDNMINVYAMMSNRSSFNKDLLVKHGFVQKDHVSLGKNTFNRYIINRKCYELLDHYKKTLDENFRIHMNFISRNKKSRWSSILLIDKTLYKHS